MPSLQESAMLISLQLTQWSARKLDHSTSYEVCQDKQADQGSATVNKQIIPKKYLADINQLVNKIRNYHYSNTLAWSHKGADLLPSRNYLKYTKQMGDYQDKFVTKVNDFVENYPKIISQVEAGLHDLYDITDYPNADEVRKKFTMQITTTPVPSSGDFRVDINKEELDKIKDKLDEQMVEANAAAERDLFARLYTALAKATISLKDPSKIFRNSLIFNLEEITKKIPLMNINDNINLNSIAKNILTNCEVIDFKELRKNPDYRAKEAENFENYLKEVELEYESINPDAEDAEGKE